MREPHTDGGRVLRVPTDMHEAAFVARLFLGALADMLVPYTGGPVHRTWMFVRDYAYPYREARTGEMP